MTILSLTIQEQIGFPKVQWELKLERFGVARLWGAFQIGAEEGTHFSVKGRSENYWPRSDLFKLCLKHYVRWPGEVGRRGII